MTIPACEDTGWTLEAGFEAALTEEGGCGDALFFAEDVEQTTELVFSVGGLAAATADAGVDASCRLELPHSEAGVVVKVGARVASPCADDVETISVSCAWVAVDGTATVDVAADGASGSVLLEGVLLERADGGTVPLGTLQLSAALGN